MTGRTIRTFARDEGGAVAATYALALIGLVAIGGVAFDYGRLMAMDSELQNAADQAALAAATQLDGSANSINRAVARASDLVSNITAISNDGDPAAVTVATVVFFRTRADAEAGTNSFTDNSLSANARYTRVTVGGRQVFYAFTPVVDLMSSPDISAMATAGMGSAICRVPPVMMCNNNTDPTVVDIDSLVGKGLKLKATGGGGAYAPGDFGFLDVGAGAADLGKLMGYGSPPGDCVEVTNPTTEPGAATSVINDFNTRFDIFDGGDNINCYSGSLCPPSDNSRKDVVQAVTGKGAGAAVLTKNDCGYATGVGGNGWRLSPAPYRPTSSLTYSALISAGTKSGYPDAMGYPRDLCHAFSAAANCVSSANGRIGDGEWDIDAYWRVNYGAAWSGQVATVISGRTYPSRYEVYKWERANRPNPETRVFTSDGKDFRDYRTATCRPSTVPGSASVDRRVLPVAIVNCTGLNGKAQVAPLDWIDVFLLEPSLDRTFDGTAYTQKGDIYVEVIGRTGQGTGGTANQYVRRDKPFLVN